jgi:hypothetical protein
MEVPVAEQSSAVVMFRALVMMVCLIAIPLAAIFGTSLPDAIKSIKDGRWPTVTFTNAAHASTPATPSQQEPPKFEPMGPVAPAPMVATVQQIQPAATSSMPPQLAANWPGEVPQRQASPVVPVGYEAPSDPFLRPAATKSNLVPVDKLEDTHAAQGDAAIARPNLPADSAAAPPRGASDPFVYTQERLQKLGATYYLLESWGGGQQSYRFYCKMAVGGNPNYTRYFEAVETDPLRAMSRVLEQVESWHAGKM